LARSESGAVVVPKRPVVMATAWRCGADAHCAAGDADRREGEPAVGTEPVRSKPLGPETRVTVPQPEAALSGDVARSLAGAAESAQVGSRHPDQRAQQQLVWKRQERRRIRLAVRRCGVESREHASQTGVGRGVYDVPVSDGHESSLAQ